ELYPTPAAAYPLPPLVRPESEASSSSYAADGYGGGAGGALIRDQEIPADAESLDLDTASGLADKTAAAPFAEEETDLLMSPADVREDSLLLPATGGTTTTHQRDERRVIEIFLEEMGAALFSCGLPLHAVEFYLTLAAHRLDVDISICSVSTTFWI